MERPLADADPLPLEVSPARAEAALAAGEVALLDVRQASEHAAGRIAGTAHVPLAELARAAAILPDDRPVVVYCRAGVRSKLAAEALRVDGIHATSMEGGLLRWAAEGRAFEGAVAEH